MNPWPYYWMNRPVAVSKSDGLLRVASMFAQHSENILDDIYDKPDCLERQNLNMRAEWLRTIAQEMALGMFDDAWQAYVKIDVTNFRTKVLRLQKKMLDKRAESESK